MHIGVPKEIKNNEFRVGLTPFAVREFVGRGHNVLVETGAGAGIGMSDADYQKAGAQIAAQASDIFGNAQLIIKVKEPQRTEWVQLNKNHILFTYLHLAADPAQAEGLLASGCAAIAYETIYDAHGGLPLLAPMSEVAGRLAIEAAGLAMRASSGGMGRLIGGVPGVAPARIVILGGGVVGTHAARMAIGLGADVSILDRSLPRLRYLDDLFAGRVKTLFSTSQTIEAEIASADAVIGAVLVPGAGAPKLISRQMLSLMKQKAVLVDVAIDQGGCFETSHPTTHAAPTYEVDGIIHYCVANMPGAVPLTSSFALNNATLPYGLALADRGLTALADDKNFESGLNIYQGAVTNKAVADALNKPFQAWR